MTGALNNVRRHMELPRGVMSAAANDSALLGTIVTIAERVEKSLELVEIAIFGDQRKK